jgi:hypothetical protein
MKKVIWSLFDSETAITQQLNSDKYIVYSIGLPSSSAVTDNFIKMDLSKRSCLKKLEKLPKPDIIFASPPCETWVNMNICIVRYYKRNYNEYNLYWQKNFKPNNFAKHHRKNRLLGQKTAFYTAEIIKKFNPNLWCVENGATSLIFKYINKINKLNGYKNLLYYDNYDSNFSLKPTYIFSNRKLLLKNNRNKIKNNKNKIAYSSIDKNKNDLVYKKDYCERSKVPIELYKHILNIYEGKEQLNLF